MDDLLDAINKLEINSEDTKSVKEELTSGNDELDQGHQSYFSWVDHEKFEEGGATAPEMIEILEDRFLETIENAEIALKYNGVELIGDKGSLAFANYFIGNLPEAKAALAEARDFIQICSRKKFIDEEYLTGFDYVFDCLELYLDTKPDENPDQWSKLPIFHGFSGKSKAGVFALKFYFYRQLRNDFDVQLDVSKKMVSLDPEYFEWHLCKAAILRYMRRQVRYDLDQPFDPSRFTEEILEIELAKSLAPDDPVCNLEYCQLLAEVMKRSKRVYQDWQVPLKCGNLVFTSLQDTVAYLKRQSSEILKHYDQSVRVNVTLADIFMKWIPRKHRDLTLAKECLLRALALHPKSSKANHRLANFYMGLDTSDIAEAEKYCILAAKYDSRNFPAVADLIQILLGDPEKNKAQLNDLFETHLNETSAPFEKRKTDLLFFKGLFLHLRGGYENEATTEWLKAQEIPNSCLHFDALFYTHDRYKWPPGHLAIPKIRQTVQFSMADTRFSAGKEEEIQKLIGTLDKAEQKEQAQLAMQANRGRGRGGGQRGIFRGRGQEFRGRGHEYRGRGHWDGQNGSTSRGHGHSGEYRGRGHFDGKYGGSPGTRGHGRGGERGGGDADTEQSTSHGNWR